MLAALRSTIERVSSTDPFSGGFDPRMFEHVPLFRELAKVMSWRGGPVNWELARQIGIAVATWGREDPEPSEEDRRVLAGSARAASASSQATISDVTIEGSNPASTAAKTFGMAGRTWARPVCRVQHREYIENIGMLGSSRYTDGLVQTPSNAVLFSAHRRPASVPLASTVIEKAPTLRVGSPSRGSAPSASAMARRAGSWSR